MKQPKLTDKQLLNGIPAAYLEELADVFQSAQQEIEQPRAVPIITYGLFGHNAVKLAGA
jgi:hypothetical protein